LGDRCVLRRVVAGANGVIVGADQYGRQATPLFNLPLFGSVVSTASLSFALTMFVRFAVIATTSFPLAFVIRPGDLAVTLAKLGVPGQFAYGVELAFRLLPSMSATVRETVAAQRLRGYEPRRSYNPIVRVRRAQPLIIAATVGVLTDAEDTADALDLRCFGTRRRTWLRTLYFDALDAAAILTAFGAATAATIANVCGGMPPLYLMF
jgi:energy-coupling factor transport system permease protein